jgi:hypothetical protein
MSAAMLIVRRSRLVAATNAAMALAVMVAASWYLAVESGAETPWYAVAMLIALLGFHVWQSLRHLTEAIPVVTIGPEGLGLPQASDAPIPWDGITRLGASRSLTMIGGGRLDLEVTPEIFARLRLGRRMFGDPVVKAIASPHGFSVMAQGLDHRAADMFAAIQTHWPPRLGGEG